MKNVHSIRYYEKRLAKLERVADYIRATALLPLSMELGGTGKETIPAAFFRHYGAVCEAVEMARRKAATF